MSGASPLRVSPDRWAAFRPGLLVALLVASAFLLRLPFIVQNVLWADEATIHNQVFGVSWSEQWPAVFRHRDVVHDDSLSQTLARVAHQDPYPPGVYILLWSLRPLGDSILHSRLIAALLLAASVGASYVWVKRREGTDTAGLVALMLCLSNVLAVRSQEIKHDAFTPFLGLAASLALIELTEPETSRGRQRFLTWLYAVSAGAGMLFHYAFVELVLAHATYVVVLRRAWVGRWRAAALRSLALSAPWYAYASAAQISFVVDWFRLDATRHPVATSWAHPVSAVGLVRDWFFTLQTVAGFSLPGDGGRMRHFAFVFLVTWLPLLVAVGTRRRRSSGEAAIVLISLMVAAVLHTAVALATGHSAAVGPHYLAHIWSLSIIGIAQSIMKVGPLPFRRISMLAAVLALAYGDIVSGIVGPAIRERGNLTLTPQMSSYLTRSAGAQDVLLFRHMEHAKDINTLYRGNALQVVVQKGQGLPQAAVDQLGSFILIYSDIERCVLRSAAWSVVSMRAEGRTRTVVVTRHEDAIPGHADPRAFPFECSSQP